jgi:hypothetical protein
VQAALKKLLCGEGERLDVPRLHTLLEAFSAYTMDPRSAGAPGAAQRRGRGSGASLWGDAVVDKGMKQVLHAIFSRRGTFVQVCMHCRATRTCPAWRVCRAPRPRMRVRGVPAVLRMMLLRMMLLCMMLPHVECQRCVSCRG